MRATYRYDTAARRDDATSASVIRGALARVLAHGHYAVSAPVGGRY